jgi:hypothetical protein
LGLIRVTGFWNPGDAISALSHFSYTQSPGIHIFDVILGIKFALDWRAFESAVSGQEGKYFSR